MIVPCALDWVNPPAEAGTEALALTGTEITEYEAAPALENVYVPPTGEVTLRGTIVNVACAKRADTTAPAIASTTTAPMMESTIGKRLLRRLWRRGGGVRGACWKRALGLGASEALVEGAMGLAAPRLYQ